MSRVWLFLVVLFCASSAIAQQRTLNFEAFGDVAIFGVAGSTQPPIILIADDSMPTNVRAALADQIAGGTDLVAVVDFERYSAAMLQHPQDCAYHSWEFEKLSKFIQKSLGVSTYNQPLLAGFGKGAALAYTTYNESPRGTFSGLFVTGLCRNVAMKKPYCANEDETWKPSSQPGFAELLPSAEAEGVWIALPSAPARVCSARETADFFDGVMGAEVEPASKGQWGEALWQADVSAAVVKARKLASARPDQTGDLADLPIHEQKSDVTSAGAMASTLAILLTGDGGWAGLDRDLADSLSARGVHVVGLNSLQFFWRKRTPDEAAEALSRLINYYGNAWGAKRVILVGYSFGADVLPFAVRRLSEDDIRMVKGVALLAPSIKADFEFKVGDWLGLEDDPNALPILPEVMALPKVPVLCAYGDEEAEEGSTLCPLIPVANAKPYRTEGGHHFDGNFDAMADQILALIAGR